VNFKELAAAFRTECEPSYPRTLDEPIRAHLIEAAEALERIAADPTEQSHAGALRLFEELESTLAFIRTIGNTIDARWRSHN
jgi:hypothetical protein